MKTINALLNINMQDLLEFPLQANMVNNAQNQRVIDKALTRLRRVEDTAIQSGKPIKITQRTLDEIVHKAIVCARFSDSQDELNTREWRILSYNLSELHSDEQTFTYVLHGLDKNWKNLYFNGLIFHVMNMWNDIDRDKREAVCSLIQKKLRDYTDTNRRYIALKNHANLFEEAGPIRLSALVRAKKTILKEAPTLIGFKASTFSQSYYDDVVINYYYQETNAKLDEIEEVLEARNSSRAKKMVIANLVLKENQHSDAIRQSYVASFARRILGDLTLIQTWAPFYGATIADKTKLLKARDIVNTWYSRRVIETFFDVCVQDPARKSFWLKYVEYVDNGFKIAGSSAVKSSLMGDPRVNGFLNRIFIETNSKTNRTAALILYIRNKVFVEFSDLGSLYVYNTDQLEIKNLKKKKYIDNINDLKKPSIGQLMEPDGYGGYFPYTFGMMRHAGFWQDRLTSWMERAIMPLSPDPLPTPEPEEREARPNPTIVPEERTEEKLNPTPSVTQSPTTSNIKPAIQKPSTTPAPKPKFVEADLFGDKNEQDPSTAAKPSVPTLYAKSKLIFDGKACIAWGEEGFYLYLVHNEHSKLILPRLYSPKTDGQIWIKKERTDGYLPIVFHTLQEDFPIGRIRRIGDKIFYKAEKGFITSYRISEI